MMVGSSRLHRRITGGSPWLSVSVVLVSVYIQRAWASSLYTAGSCLLPSELNNLLLVPSNSKLPKKRKTQLLMC